MGTMMPDASTAVFGRKFVRSEDDKRVAHIRRCVGAAVVGSEAIICDVHVRQSDQLITRWFDAAPGGNNPSVLAGCDALDGRRVRCCTGSKGSLPVCCQLRALVGEVPAAIVVEPAPPRVTGGVGIAAPTLLDF